MAHNSKILIAALIAVSFFALPVHAANTVTTQVVGVCDAYFNNLSTGPVQVVEVPSGTVCSAKAVVKYKGNVKSGKSVRFETILSSGRKEKKTKLTNSKGAAQFTFSIGSNHCFYVVKARGARPASEVITLFNSSTVNGCDQ